MQQKTYAEMRVRTAKQVRLMQIAAWRKQMDADIFVVCKPIFGVARVKNQWLAA